MAFDFSGKRVWVTGAGRGIGREVAEQFVAAGAAVVGLDLAFPEVGYPYATRLLDIGDAAAVNACCSALLADGGLDVLVNGAGVLRLGPTENLSDQDWHDCMTVNATGVFYLLRALVPHFKGQRRGAIVTIGSNAAHVPRMQMVAYCASKAAVTSLTQTVGLELAPFGVRVNLGVAGLDGYPHAARHAAGRGGHGPHHYRAAGSVQARHSPAQDSHPCGDRQYSALPGLGLGQPYHAAGSGRRWRRHPERLR